MRTPELCIYCKGPLPRRAPREHVIPKGLTAGFSGNLTIRCVCSNCNGYFGRELDQLFVEDTALAVMRYERGVKEDTRRAPSPDPGRVLLRYRGMRVELHPTPDGKGFFPYVPPQVGYPIVSADSAELSFRYWTLDALDESESDQTVDRRRVHMVGQGLAGVEEARSALGARGKRVRVVGSAHSLLPVSNDGRVGDSVQLEMGTLVDRVVRRCMVKIAFNYLAVAMAKRLRSNECLQRSDFDVVREFVRQDDTKIAPLVSTEVEMEARDSMGRKTQLPLGHSVTASWSRYGADIEAKVTLSSRLCWLVTLSRSFSGVRWDLRSGHFWDFERKRVLPMSPAIQR